MMKKYLLAAVALLMVAALLLAGCGRVTDALDRHFPEAPATEEDKPISTPLPDRTGRTYTVLLTTQLTTDDALTTVSMLTFQTADESIHWLELPADLYVRVAGNTLAGCYRRAYQTELSSPTGTGVSATQAGIEAVRDLLNTGYSIQIDYTVNLDREQFADLFGTLGNLPMTLYRPLGGLTAGEYTLTAQKAISYLTYADYNDGTQGQFEARMQLVAALRGQFVRVVRPDQLSLITAEIRAAMTTDIPGAEGEDMFFLRRFITAKEENFTVTHISTQSVYHNGERYRVMLKENALRQLNEQMEIYQKDLTAAQFDPSGVFVDPSSQIMQSVYASKTTLPGLYTLTELLAPPPEPAPETDPASSDAPQTAPATSDAG